MTQQRELEVLWHHIEIGSVQTVYRMARQLATFALLRNPELTDAGCKE